MTDLTARLEFDFDTAVAALDHHAEHRADELAVLYGETGEELTYAEFAARTDAIAGNLVSRGINPTDRISVFTTNPLVATSAMYGIWKAAAVYAPINFQYAGDLLAYQLNDTLPKLLLVDATMLERVEQVRDRLTSVPDILIVGGSSGESFDSLLEPAERPDRTVTWDDAANVIYTSGTTGPSKGVVQSHRWINSYCWVGRKMLSPDDVVYNDLPMYHVGGAHFNVARALWSGAAVSLWDRFSPSQFWERIRSTGCSAAVMLDVMIPWLLNAEAADNDQQNPLNKVHMQPLPATHHEFARRFGIDFVTSGFGQSETGASLMTLIQQTEPGEGTPAELRRGLSNEEILAVFRDQGLLTLHGSDPMPKGIMGRPAPFVEITIRNERDEECAPGVVGEMCMRPKLPALFFDEYLAKPEATVKSWRNLWFHTGDAAVKDENGIFAYVDRLGDRLRVRGENISSFHIEELIGKHPMVQLAAVIAVPSTEGDEDDVVAFVEIADGHEFDEAELHRYCTESMPKFMWPKHLVPVDSIPRTPTNKIEKYKLRQQMMEGTQR